MPTSIPTVDDFTALVARVARLEAMSLSASPDKTVIKAGSNATITDSHKNVWSIVSGQVAVNGVVDPVTNNVVQMDYVGGKIWQKNNAGSWYSKAILTDTWSAETHTDPISGVAPSTPPLTPPQPPQPPTGGAPSPAADVGYNTRTLGPNITVGQTWRQVPGDDSVVEQLANGAVLLHGSTSGSYLGLQTAYPGNGIHGGGNVSFGGGGYFEARLSVANSINRAHGWPSFWSNDIEMQAGRGDLTQWPGQPQGYNNWFEPDFMEIGQDGTYGGTLHNWYGQMGQVQERNPNMPSFRPAGYETVNPHYYGFLWVPATPNSQGYAKFFWDRQQQGPTVTWSYWDQNRPPAPNPDYGGPAFGGAMDYRHLYLILTTSSLNPMTVYSVEVWQKDGSQNWVG